MKTKMYYVSPFYYHATSFRRGVSVVIEGNLLAPGNNGRLGRAREEWETRKFVPGVARANFSQRVKSLGNHFHVVNTSCKRVPCTQPYTPIAVDKEPGKRLLAGRILATRPQTNARWSSLGSLTG